LSEQEVKEQGNKE